MLDRIRAALAVRYSPLGVSTLRDYGRTILLGALAAGLTVAINELGTLHLDPTLFTLATVILKDLHARLVGPDA